MKATLFAVVLLFVVSLPASAAVTSVQASTSPKTEQSIEKINLNKADVETLTRSFKGIGKKRAEAIVSYRKAHGNYKSIRSLAEVRGLGKSFVNKNYYQLQKVFVVE